MIARSTDHPPTGLRPPDSVTVAPLPPTAYRSSLKEMKVHRVNLSLWVLLTMQVGPDGAEKRASRKEERCFEEGRFEEPGYR